MSGDDLDQWFCEPDDLFVPHGAYRIVTRSAYDARRDQQSSARPRYLAIVTCCEHAKQICDLHNAALAGWKSALVYAVRRARIYTIIGSDPTGTAEARDLHLHWNGVEWIDERCGCRYHPDDDKMTHGGGPHVHPCEKHAQYAALSDDQIYKIWADSLWKRPLSESQQDATLRFARRLIEAIVGDAASRALEPIPIVLHCPACGARHIDEGEFATKVHHTHSCQTCGITWRPAVVATVGVRFLPGFKNAELPVKEDSARVELRRALFYIATLIENSTVKVPDAEQREVKRLFDAAFAADAATSALNDDAKKTGESP